MTCRGGESSPANLSGSGQRRLLSRPAPPLGETQRERRTQQCHGCPHEPAPPSRHAGEAQREARASQPGFQGEEAGHFLRNACNAARKSGVVRLTAFTSAPSRIPSSKRTPSSWKNCCLVNASADGLAARSEEHTSELQSRLHLVCRLLLEKKKKVNKPL